MSLRITTNIAVTFVVALLGSFAVSVAFQVLWPFLSVILFIMLSLV